MGWIGFDLDGTLAKYDGWKGVEHIGDPIPTMIDKAKWYLTSGYTVKIFTARMDGNLRVENVVEARNAIENWCLEHIGQILEVTNVKDFEMEILYDDRAVHVRHNHGLTLGCPLDDPNREAMEINMVLGN